MQRRFHFETLIPLTVRVILKRTACKIFACYITLLEQNRTEGKREAISKVTHSNKTSADIYNILSVNLKSYQLGRFNKSAQTAIQGNIFLIFKTCNRICYIFPAWIGVGSTCSFVQWLCFMSWGHERTPPPTSIHNSLAIFSMVVYMPVWF